MDVVGIKDIATLFASRAKLGDIEAEAFVNSMFSVIRQGLETDKQIKIRGFGTFKIIDVEPRESVNVNTGERFVIDSHRKVTFTPDATMKELVNKPFSLFNTVALNDGVEFDDAEAENPAETDTQEAEGDVQEVENKTQEPETEVQMAENDDVQTDEKLPEEPDNIVEAPEETAVIDDEALQETVDEAQEVVEANVAEDTEDVHDCEFNSAESTEAVLEATEAIPQEVESVSDETTDAPDGTDNTVETTIDEPTVETESAENETQADETLAPNRSHKALKVTLYCLLTLVLMAASAYVGMLYGRLYADDSSTSLCGTSAANTSTDVVSVKEETQQLKQQADTVKQTLLDTPAKGASDAQGMAVTIEKPQTDKENKPADENKKSKDSDNKVAAMIRMAEKYADKDVRVRTGAYCIVGADHTVTVSQGESLSSISRRELGPGMDCYLETFNGLSADATLKAGQTVKIPKLMLRKTLRKIIGNSRDGQ